MPFPIQMDPLGWIVVGFVAGALSGTVVHSRTRQGCLATTLIGILGGVVGGLIGRELGLDRVTGFLAAVIVAFLGAVVIRWLVAATER